MIFNKHKTYLATIISSLVMVLLLTLPFLGNSQTVNYPFPDYFESKIYFCDICTSNCNSEGIPDDSCCIFVNSPNLEHLPTLVIPFFAEFSSQEVIVQVKLYFSNDNSDENLLILRVDSLRLDLIAFYNNETDTMIKIVYPFELRSLVNVFNKSLKNGSTYDHLSSPQTDFLETTILKLIYDKSFIFLSKCPKDIIQCGTPHLWTFKCKIG